MAILWHELWHEGLEEASRLYFSDKNPEGMIACLAPLHEMIEKVGPLSIACRTRAHTCYKRDPRPRGKRRSIRSSDETYETHGKLAYGSRLTGILKI